MKEFNGQSTGFRKEIVQILHDIISETEGACPTVLEATRLRADLARVQLRVRSGQYKIASFNANRLNAPERARDLLSEVGFYSDVGRRWCELFSGIGLSTDAVVVDLCPGMAPKVELGLYYWGFKGTLIAVDKDADALRNLSAFLNLFQPRFEVQLEKVDIFSTEQFGGAPDLVVGNHILDDIIVDRYALRYGFDPFQLYLSEEACISFWERVLEDERKIMPEVSTGIAECFLRCFPAPTKLLLAQYPSYVERSILGREVSDFNKRLLRKIVSHLTVQGSCLQTVPGSSPFEEGEVALLQIPSLSHRCPSVNG
jgi:hypothetical protein